MLTLETATLTGMSNIRNMSDTSVISCDIMTDKI